MRNRESKILWAVTALPAAITGVALYYMEDSVPMHSDLAGNIDRWGSKYENLIFPIMIVLMTLFWQAMRRHYLKKAVREETEKARAEALGNATVLFWVALGMALLFTAMQCGFLYADLTVVGDSGSDFDVGKIVNVGMGMLLMVLGNVMPKTRRNGMVGVRTVWSMENDRTWAASNRFGGKVLMGAGAVIACAGFLCSGLVGTLVLLVVLLGAAAWIIAYSQRVWKRDREAQKKR